MRRRRLGNSDLEVPLVSIGAWAIGGWSWGGTDDEHAVRAIQASIDAGANAIDTAPVYGFGHSERVVGRAIADRRERAVILTKVGLRWDDPEGHGDLAFEAADRDGRKLTVRRNSRPSSVKREVEQSLERLGVETIDLVQVHWPDPHTPIADTMGALLEMRAQGKLRAIGVSNYSVAMMKEAQAALGDVSLASDQPKYNLTARDIEKEILPFARSAKIGILAYSPLEQGLLTGAVTAERTFPADDARRKSARFTAENRRRVNAALARTIQPIAKARGVTIGQVVIAWTVAQPGITSALVGARTPEQARENAAAGELELTAAELAAIRAEFERVRLHRPIAARVRARLHGIVRRLRAR